MQFNAREVRALIALVKKAIAEGKDRLRRMSEDTDEHMELANDLMVLDVLLSKLESRGN